MTSEIISRDKGIVNAIRLLESTYKFPNGQGQIEYRCAGGSVDLWDSVPLSSGPFVHLTTLEVSSGGGKTTLVNLLHTFLNGDLTDHNVRFSPHVSSRHVVSYIPQRSNTVRHWKVSHLVPPNCKYLSCLFEEQISDTFYDRYLSSFSGGQIARILVASAIERLQNSRSEANFLLLDEAFEGIDSALLTKSLNGIAGVWRAQEPPAHLFVILVTHLDVSSFAAQIDRGLIAINRVFLTREASEFRGEFEIIPVKLQPAGTGK